MMLIDDSKERLRRERDRVIQISNHAGEPQSFRVTERRRNKHIRTLNYHNIDEIKKSKKFQLEE